MNEINSKLPLRLLFPIFIVYIIISAFGLHYHELGLEEGQHFLFGRDSTSLPDLYQNMRYEGHPRLWGCLLYLITHYVTTSYVGLQVFHLLITATTVFIFLRYAPFNLLIKLLVVFGYYLLFEYDLLSRSYSLGILFLFITCQLLRDTGKYLPVIGCMLILLCNTDLFYAFAAVGIFLYLVIEYADKNKLFTPSFCLLTILFLLGIASAVIQAQIPRADYVIQTIPTEWLSPKHLSVGLYALIRGWLPIPLAGGHFWNTYWLNKDNMGGALPYVLFLLLLLLPGVLLKDERKSLVFYYSSLFLLLSLLIVTMMGAYRYFGMVYIYFLAACWMRENRSTDILSLKNARDMPPVRFFFRTSFYLLLTIQLLVGLYALQQDFSRPFSQSKNAVAYINKHQLSNQEIVVDGYITGPALSAYLGKKVFYLDTGQEGSFCYWRRPYFPRIRKTVGQEMSQAAFLQGVGKFILITDRQINENVIQSGNGVFQFDPLCNFQNGILTTEDNYIYQATRKTTNQM
jgi:hypothetical protein